MHVNTTSHQHLEIPQAKPHATPFHQRRPTHHLRFPDAAGTASGTGSTSLWLWKLMYTFHASATTLTASTRRLGGTNQKLMAWAGTHSIQLTLTASGRSCFSLGTMLAGLPSMVVSTAMNAPMNTGANSSWSSTRLITTPVAPGAVTAPPRNPYQVVRMGPTNSRPSAVKVAQRLALSCCCSTTSWLKMSPSPLSSAHVTQRVSIGWLSSMSR
mmetsp:Transcript_12362/g.30317  ORF Transcript_12362/g.30317 Transcript_12362/m.30317 type:complete len:213 (+) Transcript_12362:214-852(+)